uniref:Uncharacterized protein n=1 Tax=viral metagenome TaxID=1070528 RepID=A0A6C0JHT4_9ZZZZ
MFSQNEIDTETSSKPVVSKSNENIGKYKNIINSFSTTTIEHDSVNVDKLLEMEKQHNKNEQWNKLDKTIKIQKLHQYAEKYGKEHNLPMKDIKSLKIYFVSCLETNKLQKTKEVLYDKHSKEITSIPSLTFNSTSRNFTLKNVDSKRVSTLKSLTPKRVTEKNKEDVEI